MCSEGPPKARALRASRLQVLVLDRDNSTVWGIIH